ATWPLALLYTAAGGVVPLGGVRIRDLVDLPAQRLVLLECEDADVLAVHLRLCLGDVLEGDDAARGQVSSGGRRVVQADRDSRLGLAVLHALHDLVRGVAVRREREPDDLVEDTLQRLFRLTAADLRVR